MAATSVDDVDRLRALPSESHHLEFKEAGGSFGKNELRDYCVGLANDGGGFLVLGVSDKLGAQGSRPVVGTGAFPNAQEMEHWVLQVCKFRVDIDEVAHPDGRVVVVRIPGRPKGMAYEASGRFLMRAGSSLVPMTPDRLRTIFAETAPHWGEEPIREGVSAQDVVSLLDTQRFFDLLRLQYPSNQQSVLDKLAEKRLVERRTSSYTISRLGALLLAKRYPRTFMRSHGELRA